MKYCKDSILPGVKDFYSITSYYIDKLNKKALVHLLYVEHIKDGTANFIHSEHHLVDRKELIIDPNWSSESEVPKPSNFVITDPSTWGALAFDEIPKVLNPDKLYASRVVLAAEQGKEAIEAVLIDGLIEGGFLSNDFDVWEKI